jgi:GH15 family glucan-1,4-alpha-glucosidase
MAEELRQRETCDICLYVITPKMTGVYSIAEVIDDSNKRPNKTVLVRLRTDENDRFTDGNGGHWMLLRRWLSEMAALHSTR